MRSVLQDRRGAAIGGLLAAIALLLAANAVAGTRTGHVHRKVVILEGAEAFHFEDLPSMVATSTAVVRGSVVGSSRGKVIDEQEVVYTRKLLDIQVEQTLAGQPTGPHAQLEVAGWRQVNGEAETELQLADQLPTQLGDQGIFFLYDFEHDGRYGMVNTQGVYLADGAQVRDSHRTDPLVRQLEALTMADLNQLIEQAKDAVKAGDVKPQPYPGSSP
ncbi:MAG TPA: hypothetical protein VFA46_13230 [Actinomycetes bacterium]|nr:hypothetical protein [Actinomycetes bacterium]